MPKEYESMSRVYQGSLTGYESCLTDIKQIENDTLDYLKQWKKEYAGFLRETRAPKRGKKKAVVAETKSENVDISSFRETSESYKRPTRNARNVAIDNIRKHSMMPLGSKLRRPDSVGDVNIYSIISAPKSIGRIETIDENTQELFAKPKPRKRKIQQSKISVASAEVTPFDEKEVRKNPIEVAVEEGVPLNSTVVIQKEVKEANPEQPIVAVVEKESKKHSVLKVDGSTPQRITRSSGRKIVTPVPISPIQPLGNEIIGDSPAVDEKTEDVPVVGIIKESPNASKLSSVSVHSEKESRPIKSRVGTTEESDIFESSTLSRPSSDKKKRKKNKKKGNATKSFVDFRPNAESSSLHIDLNNTRTLTPQTANLVLSTSALHTNMNHTRSVTPKNGTFIVNEIPPSVGEKSETRADIFANVTETVVKGKKKISKEVVCVSQVEESLHEAMDEVDRQDEAPPAKEVEVFQIPEPIPAKRTKVLRRPKCFDADGNVLEVTATKRTKVLAAPTVSGVPEVTDACPEGRPVRIRTKVRRFGMSDETEPSEQNQTNTNTQAGKAITRQSKARRASLKINQHLLNRLQASQKKATPLATQKMTTPLATVTNNLSAHKQPYTFLSASKENPLRMKQKHDMVKVVNKQAEHDMAKLDNLKTKQMKEEAAALKKIEEMNRRKELLKQKNEEKLERAKNKRDKEAVEKMEQIKQIESEKERKRKILLLERERKQKEEINRKKLMLDQKQAHNEERRRQEEEARLEKIREMELEQQRLNEEKQRRLEYEEKRAKERIEEQKRMMEAEKLQRQKMAEERAELEKKQNAKQYYGVYTPRNEDDLGLEDEVSEESGEDDEAPTPVKKLPSWVGDKKGNPITAYITKEQMDVYMPLRSRTPDVHRMFNMSPGRTIRRNSSAIWETTILQS